MVIFFIMVLLLTFFYTEVLFEQQNYRRKSRKKQGAQIPGILRGEPTQRYLARVRETRFTLVGAVFLAVVAVLPYFLQLVLPEGAAKTYGLFIVSVPQVC